MDAGASSRADPGAHATAPAADAHSRRLLHEVGHEDVRPEDLRALRHDLVAWVHRSAGHPEGPALAERLEDVGTALYEALTNVVDHAYPEGAGPVRVTAHLAPADGPPAPGHVWLEIEVADRGGWCPVPDDPGHRGRGLLLLSRLTDGHEVHRNGDGTRVRLWWHRPP